MSYNGWSIDQNTREELLGVFPPLYPDVIAHHITSQMGVREAPSEVDAVIVGYAHDDGVQCLVVELNGSVDRPHGGIYHITWSIDRAAGRKPFHSNVVLENGYNVTPRINIKVVPFFHHNGVDNF